MKKRIKNTIISLALCASAALFVGGLSFMHSDRTVTKTASAATLQYTMDGFTIAEAASIRNSEPNGIRFCTEIDENTQAAIDGLNLSDISYGTLMLPADMLGSQELTHETESILDIPVSRWQNEEQTIWTSVLTGSKNADGSFNNLSETYYNRPIAARSYVKGTLGEDTVYYYTANTAVRSIGYVAVMETITNGNITELVETVAKKTNVELVFNENGQVSILNTNENTGEHISNALMQESDSVAVLRIGGIVAPSGSADITYSVENTDIIGVNGSTLTANAAGETVVTANCTFNGKDLSVSKMVSTTEYRGVSDYKILITEEAKVSPDINHSGDFAAGGQSKKATFERTAAEKLQQILLEATGVELPIVTSVNSGEKYISVGETAEAIANTTLTVTGDTSAQVFVDDNGNAYIRGSVANESVLYGVQQFLGDAVGYEFYMENTYTYDTDKEVVIKAAEYELDIPFNVIQGDVRTAGIMDDYTMQSYTRNMIALGIAEISETTGKHHQGVAHNSVNVVGSVGLDTTDYTQYTENGLRDTTAWTTTKNDLTTYPWANWYAISRTKVIGTLYNEKYYYIDDPHTTTVNYEEIKAELCYTAHGDTSETTGRPALIKLVADEMLAELKDHPTLFRLGFGQMDHRVWCQCEICAAANPSDNLLEFLLDVAAEVKSRWSETGRSDADKELFKISTLFYHATGDAPTKTANYTNKLESYGKHIEIWFAESAGDYVVPITDTSSAWNTRIHDNILAFAELANTYHMDMLWWCYYGMVTQFFVPYDSFEAIRANYAFAAELGIDYNFNQMMQSKVNFSRLKEYLMSKLAWNAGTENADGSWTQVDDDTWNSWIQNYFDGAYGAGSAKMTEYYTLWKEWASDNKDTFINSADYDEVSDGGTNDASTWNDDVLRTDRETYFPEKTLQNWLDLIDQAIAALDPNDPNYETYYWNIKLEKLTPLYLMLYVHGGNNIDNTTSTGGALLATGTFSDESYVLAYGQEFLEITDHWDMDYYGEGLYLTTPDNSETEFSERIQEILDDAGASSTSVNSRQTVVAGSSFTLNNDALAAGTYDISIVNANGNETRQTLSDVSVSAGTVTVTANVTAGETYIVELKSSSTIVKFTNVLAITGYITTVDQLKSLSGNGYWVLANDINCENATFASTSTFSGVLDGGNKTVSNLTVGNGGIFGTLSGATVKDVNFVDVAFSGETMTAESVFGTMDSDNAPTFENVSIVGDNAADLWPEGINVNYTKAEKMAYVVSGQKDTVLQDAAFKTGDTYTVTVDGIDITATVYRNGKLSVTVGAMAVGAQKTVVCRNNATNNAYGFDVIGVTKAITTADELRELGVGGMVNPNTGDITGYYVLANDITVTHDDTNYTDVFAAGYPTDYVNNVSVTNRFKGTFDGNGYTIDGIRVADGGIFGAMDSATIKNVNFTNVEYLRNGVPSTITNQQGGYMALLGHSAPNSTFENINIGVASVPSTWSWKRMGLLLVTGSQGAATFRDITIDAAGLTIDNLLGISHNGNQVYENVTIIAEGYNAIGYTGDSYTTDSTGAGVQNTAVQMTEFPAGITFQHPFTIENTETEVEIGKSFDMTVSSNYSELTYTYSLKEAVDGVSISGSTVSVSSNATIGETFTVVATSSEGYEQEMTFTVVKARVALDGTVTIETITDTLDLSGISGISGEILSIKVESSDSEIADLTVYSGSTAAGAIAMSNRPVQMAHLGDDKALLIETESAIYTVNANVYTMIIDNAEELEQFYTAAADNALAAGLNIEAQKGFTQSGYFVLGADIEYNKVWTHIAYGTRWAACYQNKEIWIDQSLYVAGKAPAADNMVEGAIVEDWGAGNKGGFHGVFDGKGHAIVGLELKGDYAGFIGTMGSAGVLKNVAFTDLVLGAKTGLVERGGVGGFVENVYVEIDSIESGVESGKETKLMTVHGHTKFTNVIVNVTECDFTGVEYVYLLNSAYNVSENIYVIDNDSIAEKKTDWNTDTGATAFWHFNTTSDTGAKFATVEALLADATHGAVVSSLGGYWKVESGKLYFGDTEVVTAAEKAETEINSDEYTNDINHQITFENASFTAGSVWTVEVGGVESEVTVETAGQVTVTIDPMAINATTTTISLNSGAKTICYDNVNVITYIKTVDDLKAIAMGENNTSATDNLYGYYVLANDITFEHADDYSDVIAAGYHKAGDTSYSHQYSFQGVFDGNGFTIDNMRVSDGGIFGFVENATIRNFSLTNVHLLDSVPESISKQKGGYAGILSYAAPGSTFQDIQMTIASSPASVWTWKRDGLFVISGSAGATTFRNITVDASYIELKTLLGISHNSGNVYEDVVIKAASYAAIGYTADSYGTGGVQNTAAMLTEFPSGVTFEKVAYAEIPNQPLNASKVKLTPYTGDETAFGFAEGTNIFEIVNTNQWNDRILFPADSDNYDYVEFDIYTGAATTAFTAWPSDGTNTQGSMSIYGSQMQTSDGLVRSVQVFDKDGNTFASQYTGGFAANTFYTIRICFVEGETVKYVHFGTSTLQTYYVTAARWGSFDVENDVYTSDTGALLAKYDGDVTALGFEEGSTVTQATLTDAWSNRVGINTSIKYDYVDVEFSFTGDCTVSSLCVWAYGTDAKILTGNYTVSASGCTASSEASARKAQILGADGNAVTELAANTVYTLRVYLNGDAASIAVSTFDTSTESTAILNFGDITFGNEIALDETVEISLADGSFTLPEAVEGTVTMVTVDGITVYSKDVGSLDGNVVTTNVQLTAGEGKAMVIYTDSAVYTLSATVKMPEVTGVALQNTSNEELTAYSGDTTSMGFKAGDAVYEITTDNVWSSRILIPADSDTYDYVEFDVYPTVKVSAFTAWPSNGSGTQGSMSINGARMTTSDGLARTVQVWDANGNTFAAQYSSGFAANTFYTIRICFVEGETVKYVHFGTGTAQTYYISSARWGTFDVENDVYDNTTGTLHAKYEGDVTALGFDEGSTVTQVTISDGWSSRVGVNGNIKYDYVDVEWSFTGDRTVSSLCVWMYGTNASILSGNYTVTASGCTASSDASERTLQIFDTDYNAVTAFTANTVYVLRVYLNGDASTFAVSTFNTSADSTAILNFGDITFGNAYESDEYVIFETTTGSYTLPDSIDGSVKKIVVGDTTIYDATTGNITGNIGTYDVDLTVGTEYEIVIYTYGNDTYTMKAIAADGVIRTATELQALGVGGRTVDGVKQGQGNSEEAGNDVTGYYVIANDIDASGVYFAAGYFRYGSYFRATLDGLGHTVNNVIVSEGGMFGGMLNATVKNVTFAGVRYHGTGCGAGYNGNVNWGQYFGLFAHWADKITVSNVKVVVDEMKHNDWKNVSLLVYNVQTATVSTFTDIEIEATGIALNTALTFNHTGTNTVYENVSIKAASVNVIAYSDNGTTAVTEWPTGITYTQDATIVQFENTANCITYKYAGDVTELGFEAGTTVFVAEQDARTSMWSAGSVLGLNMENQKTMIYKSADEDYASIQFSVSKDITSYSSYLFFSWYYIDGTNKGAAGYLKSDGNASGCPTGFSVIAYNLDGTQATSFVANTVYELRWYGEGATAFGVGLAAQNENPEVINVYWANPSSGSDAA